MRLVRNLGTEAEEIATKAAAGEIGTDVAALRIAALQVVATERLANYTGELVQRAGPRG